MFYNGSVLFSPALVTFINNSRDLKQFSVGDMVIRRKDAEADADADAETQMNVDFEAGGSSTDAYWHQLGSSWEAEFLLGSPKAEQASRVQLRITFSLNYES